jgi:hypothetical protein
MFNRSSSGFLRCLAAVVLFASAGAVQANALAQAPVQFSQSSLQNTAAIESSGHLVLFSPVREIRNEIRSDVMARLPVSGQGQLFEINRDASREAALDHYLTELRARGASVLYQCSGIQCGRNNVWANQIFQQSRLLGRDGSQDYVAAAVEDENGTQWLTLVYTVTRGNLREYVWVEQLEVGAGASIPGFEASSGRMKGPVVVPWSGGVTYRFDFSADDRRRLTDWAADEGAEVVLAAFSSLQDDERLEAALERARQAGDALAEVLGKTGISRSQIRIVTVGPVVQVEDPDRRGDRVEVLVIKR